MKCIKLFFYIVTLLYLNFSLVLAADAPQASGAGNAVIAQQKKSDPKIIDLVFDALDGTKTLGELKVILEQQNLDVNYQDKNGVTPLLFLMRVGDNDLKLKNADKKNKIADDIAKLLIEFGAKVEIKDRNKDEDSPFTFALTKLKNNTLLQQTIINNYHLDNLSSFETSKLKNMVEMRGGNSLIYFAVKGEMYDRVKQLMKLKARANINNSEGVTPLILATKMNNKQLVEILLNENSQNTDEAYKFTTVDKKAVLDWASKNGYNDVKDKVNNIQFKNWE